MRISWDINFPDILVHTIWKSDGADEKSGLWDHPLYSAAKGQRDVYSAVNVIDDVADERVLEALHDLAIETGKRPILIAPAADLSETNNALAITYAQWLSSELGWQVEDRVFQNKLVSRDKQGAWFRLAHRAEFYGEIDTHTPYVLVDDVVTLGGTLADLRSFIHGKGGHVIAMSTLASNNGCDKQIRLDEALKNEMERKYGTNFTSDCCELFGFGYDCFTHEEGKQILRRASYDEIRKSILRARDEGNASRSKKRTGKSS